MKFVTRPLLQAYLVIQRRHGCPGRYLLLLSKNEQGEKFHLLLASPAAEAVIEATSCHCVATQAKVKYGKQDVDDLQRPLLLRLLPFKWILRADVRACIPRWVCIRRCNAIMSCWQTSLTKKWRTTAFRRELWGLGLSVGEIGENWGNAIND